jgi:ferritin-like metal-binding protein YciE
MLRQYSLNYAELNKKLEDFISESNMQFRDIYEVLDALMAQKKELEKPSNPIGFVKK